MAKDNQPCEDYQNASKNEKTESHIMIDYGHDDFETDHNYDYDDLH